MIDYPWCAFDFSEWNPMQRQCLPYFTEDRNLVVSASVASGKTAVAEAIMGYELMHGRCIYVSPLRSIGLERYESWTQHQTFSQHHPILVDGDHHPDSEEMAQAGVIITTVESLDIACRARMEWVRKSALLVVDEAHFLCDESRGSSLEAVLMAFTLLNPKARVVMLSGTMSNAKELAVWLKSLNGKPTAFVQSSWRPTPLMKRVETADGFTESLNAAMHEIFKGEKTLIFVHSKRLGEELCRRLKKKGVRCAFFASDLDEQRRKQVLASFRALSSGLDVLVSTSSLAMGVNI